MSNRLQYYNDICKKLHVGDVRVSVIWSLGDDGIILRTSDGEWYKYDNYGTRVECPDMNTRQLYKCLEIYDECSFIVNLDMSDTEVMYYIPPKIKNGWVYSVINYLQYTNNIRKYDKFYISPKLLMLNNMDLLHKTCIHFSNGLIYNDLPGSYDQVVVDFSKNHYIQENGIRFKDALHMDVDNILRTFPKYYPKVIYDDETVDDFAEKIRKIMGMFPDNCFSS